MNNTIEKEVEMHMIYDAEGNLIAFGDEHSMKDRESYLLGKIEFHNCWMYKKIKVKTKILPKNGNKSLGNQ